MANRLPKDRLDWWVVGPTIAQLGIAVLALLDRFPLLAIMCVVSAAAWFIRGWISRRGPYKKRAADE